MIQTPVLPAQQMIDQRLINKPFITEQMKSYRW